MDYKTLYLNCKINKFRENLNCKKMSDPLNIRYRKHYQKCQDTENKSIHKYQVGNTQ